MEGVKEYIAPADSTNPPKETAAKPNTSKPPWGWNIIGFLLGWESCRTCNRRLSFEDRSDEYCNNHCDDDLGL